MAGPARLPRARARADPLLSGGVHAAGEGSIDPRALSAALLAALDATGREVRTGAAVNGALIDGERILGVTTAGGEELRAPAVVLATGAWPGRGRVAARRTHVRLCAR